MVHLVEKTTTERKKDETLDKGFGLAAREFKKRREALRKFCRVMKREAYPLLGALFAVAQSAFYREEALLDVIICNAIKGVTSENGTKAFRDEYERENPSPRTIRYRLKKVGLSETARAFQEINEQILNRALKMRLFENPVLLSIDITYNHFYGKRRKFACGMERDRGTNYGYKYVSCVISAPGIRFTLHTVPMTEFTRAEDVVAELIREARKWVTIRAVLLDRGFFNSPCIKKLGELGVYYLMPVIKHQEEFLQSLRPPCKKEMPMGPKDKRVSPIIVAVKDPDDQKKTLYYATNMYIPDDSLEEVIDLYRKRWTIENAFKSQKLVFLGKTYSVNFAIRFFFWVMATLLYNVWILCNLAACMNLGLDPSIQERPVITAFLFGETMRAVFLSPLFDEGDTSEQLRTLITLMNHALVPWLQNN